MNFDRANHSFLHPFLLRGNRFSKYSGWNFVWGTGAWVKGCVEIENWGTSKHFVLGFQENSIYTLHLRFSYDSTKWCKCNVCTKTNSWLQKSHEEFGQLQKSCWSSKSWNSMSYICPKNTFLQSKHDIQRIYITLLSTTCKNSIISLCHFWNRKSFFMTQLFSIFLAQIPHTFYKSSPSKSKFSDFSLLALTFTKFLSFFKQKVGFSSKFRSFFSVMRDNSSVLF